MATKAFTEIKILQKQPICGFVRVNKPVSVDTVGKHIDEALEALPDSEPGIIISMATGSLRGPVLPGIYPVYDAQAPQGKLDKCFALIEKEQKRFSESRKEEK